MRNCELRNCEFIHERGCDEPVKHTNSQFRNFAFFYSSSGLPLTRRFRTLEFDSTVGDTPGPG